MYTSYKCLDTQSETKMSEFKAPHIMVTLVLTAADLADQLSVYSSSHSPNLAVSRGQGRGETFRLSHSHAHTHTRTNTDKQPLPCKVTQTHVSLSAFIFTRLASTLSHKQAVRVLMVRSTCFVSLTLSGILGVKCVQGGLGICVHPTERPAYKKKI